MVIWAVKVRRELGTAGSWAAPLQLILQGWCCGADKVWDNQDRLCGREADSDSCIGLTLDANVQPDLSQSEEHRRVQGRGIL